MSDKLLKKYEFKKIHDKAPKLTKAVKIRVLEELVRYRKSASMAKEDFIKGNAEVKNFEIGLAKITAYETAILAMGYTVEEREAGEQHDKQKN